MARRRGQKQGKKLAGAVLFLAFAAAALYLFGSSPFFALTAVEVRGVRRVSPAEVRSLAGVSEGTNIFAVDLELVRKRLLSHPLLAEARVRRVLPRTLLITVRERTPRALMWGRDSFLVLDARGFCLDKVLSPGSYRLPLVTGLRPEREELGARAISSPVALLVLESLAEDLQPYLSEVNVSDPYHIVAYTREGIPLLLGDTGELEQKLRLAVALREGLGGARRVAYIDVRAVSAPAVKYLDEKGKS